MGWWARLTRWWRPDPQVSQEMALTQAQLELDRTRRADVERRAQQLHERGVDGLAELIDRVLADRPPEDHR